LDKDAVSDAKEDLAEARETAMETAEDDLPDRTAKAWDAVSAQG